MEGCETMALIACLLCHVLKEQEHLHRCWRCGKLCCSACAHPDRWGDYECQACVLWQRTCEVMREPSFDD
jgi:hypothetical protein